MTVTKYRKKPVVIEALVFDGNNAAKVAQWCGGRVQDDGHPKYYERRDYVMISTLEGEMMCSPGDYVIKGVQGEFYPCKPEIFEQTYEPVAP